MHKSKLAGFIIDCQTGDIESAAAFWMGALGMARGHNEPDDKLYVALKDDAHQLAVEVQSVDHPSRVHLDIESDDVEAEVQRLVALGAKSIGPVKRWWVMEAPTGQRFCVVPPVTPDFETLATSWP